MVAIMISFDKLKALALMFENKVAFHPDKTVLTEFINILEVNDENELNQLDAFLKKIKKQQPQCDSLACFLKQYRLVRADALHYEESLKVLDSNLKKLAAQEHAALDKISTGSYFKILELAGHHASMYEAEDNKIDHVCECINEFLMDNHLTLTGFDDLFHLEKESKALFQELDGEFQKELKGKIHSGDILQPVVAKEQKVMPDLHASAGILDKIYFWFKNLVTKDSHSALIVYDKTDNAMHYSHVVDEYQNNKVELHHFLYSDVYRVEDKLFENMPPQNQQNQTALDEYRAIHENLYKLCKENNEQAHVRLVNTTFRKVMSGIVNLLYKTFPFIGRFLAKDNDTDKIIAQVLTSPKVKQTKQSNTLPEQVIEPKSTKIFCSEFVANSLAIAAEQSPALSEKWQIHRRAQYVPPQALADHLKKECLVKSVKDTEDIPLMRMFQ